MTTIRKLTSQNKRGGVNPREKKTYSQPRIIFREPLEVVAAVCDGPGQKNPGDFNCGLTMNFNS